MTADDKAKSESSTTVQSTTDFKTPAPDGGYGWVVLTASFVNNV